MSAKAYRAAGTISAEHQRSEAKRRTVANLVDARLNGKRTGRWRCRATCTYSVDRIHFATGHSALRIQARG